jgi:3-deoxy-7-phosphoheptulonate synthase
MTAVEAASDGSAPSDTTRTAHQPDWPDAALVAAVRDELRRCPPLVGENAPAELLGLLSRVGAGEALVVQGGDCAEMFADARPRMVARKLAQLDDVSAVVERLTGLPVITIGRLAGQYGKPRSTAWETRPDGTRIPNYFGDAVNSARPDPLLRRPDPRRLLEAYRRSRLTHATLDSRAGDRPGRRVFTSHEALLLDYEQPLVRTGRQGTFASSAHLLWIGNRTRQLTGQHVAFAESVDNPVAVKLGPEIDPREAVLLSHRLNPRRLPGRLTYIVRLGAVRIRTLLPPLLTEVTRRGAPVLWLCDPMHGNTVRLPDGRKTRSMASITEEMAAFVEILRRHGVPSGGLHLELTPRQVTECVDGPLDDPRRVRLRRYRAVCDPRLNPAQAETVAADFARQVAEGGAACAS